MAPAQIEVDASYEAITGMIIVCQQPASALFDLGFTFSYVSVYFSSRLDVSLKTLLSRVYVGGSFVVDQMCKAYMVTLQGFDTQADLLLLDILDFDII